MGLSMSNRLLRLARAWLAPLALLLGCAGTAGAATPVNQILLVQNSGWMLPFYDDPASKFKQIVEQLSSRIAEVDDNEFVVSFNQALGSNKSPLLVYHGSDPARIRAAIYSIEPAHKPGSRVYADTDFKQAVVGAIRDFSAGRPAILWIITNNKNSPNNSAETAEKNAQFYHFLQDTPQIARIVAFPYAMPVRSRALPSLRANGLMIYAIAYGAAADQMLRQMLARHLPFGQQPARLKPLNAQAVTFVPLQVAGHDVRASLAPDGRTLVLTFSATNSPSSAEIIGRFRNDFYPYDIRSASVGLQAAFRNGQGITTALSSNHIDDIVAGGVSPKVTVRIGIPPIPSEWSPQVIFGNGRNIPGLIRLSLTNQQLAIARPFAASMAQIFPQDPLPDLFVPGPSARQSVSDQPLLIVVQYPATPLIVLLVGAALLLAGLIGGGIALRREKIYPVSVDGVRKNYTLRPFTQIVLRNAQGERIGTLSRGLGAPRASLDKGRNAQIRIS